MRQTHSASPNLSFSKHEFGEIKDIMFSLVGACSGLGQPQGGVEVAPEVLRNSGLLKDFKFRDCGDFSPRRQHPSEIWSYLQYLKTTLHKVFETGHPILTVGGDHSIAIATIGATLERDPESAVVWIDAHGDMNTPDSTLTGNIHGMPLAALLGLFENPVSTAKLRPENLFMIGTRDLDDYEKEKIAALQIQVLTAADFKNNFEPSLLKLKKWLACLEGKDVHVSFDIDAVDPCFAPATGLHVMDGLETDQLYSALKIIKQMKNISALDIVEINSSATADLNGLDSTLKITQRLIEIAFT